MMTKLNAKLDVGWKITYTSYPVYNGTTMKESKPDNTELFFPSMTITILSVKFHIKSESQKRQNTN